ncbi:GNAT family N-acetyltransferase [Candidatus Thorarchaeota archaeon]|nr:MAG: GNAT family N-acetyltransferase [Candidatus Thorarchaeota archaeon]
MFEIRKATDVDRSLLENMYLEEIEDHAERASKFAEDLIDHFKTMLAMQDNQLCGTLTWYRRGGFDDGVVEIIGLGVNGKFQRQGVAKKLVNYFIQETSKFYSENGYSLRVIMLFMEGNNEVARKFYSNLGFIEVARIPKLYPHDDGVIWIKHI